MKDNEPKILIWDIETAPLTAYCWGLWDQNIGLNQIKKDWHLLAWSAKWLGEPASKTMYMDNRGQRNVQDDKHLIIELSKLLNKADIIITQNGEKFDVRKLNARAVMHGLPPIKPCKSTDLLKESRKVFAFTSHKLEYMADVLNTKYKKLKHKKYPGFELWAAILAGDKQAWKEMQTYCIHDVLATEELYGKLYGWIRTQNMATYMDGAVMRCKCGSDKLTKEGFARLEAGKYQIYHCKSCGKWPRGAKNLLTHEQRQNMLRDWRTLG